MAWAIVTAAGMPYRCCAAIAPGATRLMNACWAAVPGTAADGGSCLRYVEARGPAELPPGVSAAPGTAAQPSSCGIPAAGPFPPAAGPAVGPFPPAAGPAACAATPGTRAVLSAACALLPADSSWLAVLTRVPLSTNPSTPWERSGFQQKLVADGRVGRAHGFAQANFARALADRGHHNI